MSARPLHLAAILAATLLLPARARGADPKTDAEKVLPAVAPSGGVDRDLTLALDRAERLATDDPSAAMKLVMPIFAAPNRFTTAQKPLFGTRAAQVLRLAGQRQIAHGQVALGLRAYDAAWQIDPKADPAYSAALVDAADQERSSDPAAALWMARRARVVAPTYDPARERDDRWSHNRLAPYGHGLMIAGLVAAAAGVVFTVLSNNAQTELTSARHDRARADDLIATQRSFGLGAGVAFGTGAVTFASGLALLLLGNPKESPRSPSYLPAFQEASR